MAISGASKDYDFGQKKHWRRTQWNQILSRTKGREKTHPILYLAGPEDNDRLVAIDKGVPRQNLIAIDRDRTNVERVRSESNPALHADIESVLRTWPADRRVSAVMLDFCSGLESRYFLDLREPLCRTPFAGAAISLNLQRGRDKSSEAHRSALQRAQYMNVLRHFSEHVRFISRWSDDDKNRAAMFITILAIDLADGALSSLGFDPAAVPHMQVRLFKNVLSILKPTFHSYQSGAVIFDSVVFTQIQLPDGSGLQTEIEHTIDYGRNITLARKISAMLAVRTKRLGS